jgi:DNA-binding transcriptional ArsR family regulator
VNRPSIYILSTDKQLVALASAARQEIVDVLGSMGTVSVAELAVALGRPADALYFHLRVLTRVGLVRPAGERSRNGRREALFRVPADELRLRYNPRDPANRRRVTTIVGSMLRLGIRDFERAFRRLDVKVLGPQRELWALRKVSRLSPARVADINSLIEGLKNAVASPDAKGRLYAITVLLTPLDRSRQTRKAEPAKRSKKK